MLGSIFIPKVVIIYPNYTVWVDSLPFYLIVLIENFALGKVSSREDSPMALRNLNGQNEEKHPVIDLHPVVSALSLGTSLFGCAAKCDLCAVHLSSSLFPGASE
jgi:hypothetical protein